MTADCPDNFEYERASSHVSKAQREHYWAVASGLQKVDGLKVSSYAKKAAEEYIRGTQTLSSVGNLIRSHHADGHDPEHKEADLVCQRISELLEKGAFYLGPAILPTIHRYLFQDLDPSVYHPGEFKTERMVKKEEILNGDSVLYADPIAYEMSINGAFAIEQSRTYTTFDEEELRGFCRTAAFLWQVHPFFEGNTRTVAVFAELYLNYLGFQVTNEPFEENSRYFRDALVRAMYRNAPAGIAPDDQFLVAFFENVLDLANNELIRDELFCRALFENPSLLRNVDPSEALQK